MKRIFNLLLLCFVCVTLFGQLPRKSTELIHRYYPNCTIKSYSKIDKLYWVSLSNNTIIKFKRNGDLVEIIGHVPYLILPYKINNHIMWYSGRPARYYHKHKKGYDIHLHNGRQVKYNRRYKERK